MNCPSIAGKMNSTIYLFIYIYICSPPHGLYPNDPQWRFYLTFAYDLWPPWQDAEFLTVARWEEASAQSIWFAEKCCYFWKCCLQVTIGLEDKIFPQIRNTILARKLSCVKGCNTCFNEAQPSSHFSCMTMVFCFLMKYRGNIVIKNNALLKHI